MIVTTFKSMVSKVAIHSNVNDVLLSIKEPRQAVRKIIDQIRIETDKDKIEKLKKDLPWILFAGKFTKRANAAILEGSGLIILDYDKDFTDKAHIESFKNELKKDKYVYSVFYSPSGAGLKVVVRIPKTIDNEEYNAYFNALSGRHPHFDGNNKGIARTCFASFDPNIYINENAEVWTQKVIVDETLQLKPPVTNRAQTEISNTEATSWDIWQYVILPYVDKQLTHLGRNQAGLIMASACNDYNIPKVEAVNYVFGELSSWSSDHKYEYKEVLASVENAYKKPSANKVANLAWINKDKQLAQLNKPRKQLELAPNFESNLKSDIVPIEPKKELKKVQIFNYWASDSKKNKFIPDELLSFINSLGYMVYKPNDNDHTFIKKDGKIIDMTYLNDISKDVMDDVRARDSHVFNDLIKDKCVNDKDFLYHLNHLPNDSSVLRDSKKISYIPFKNGILKITPDNQELISYDDWDGYIWSKDLIDHDYIPAPVNIMHNVYDFFTKITDDRQSFAGLLSAIGYMLSTYKDPSEPRVVILNDKHSDGYGSNGGSGKSLIMKLLGYIRPYCRIDGKTIDPKKDFAWQKVDIQHKIVGLDDMVRGFDFEKIFSIVTDGFEVNRKYQHVIEIPYDKSPKIIISTNRRIKGTDSSSNRRRYDVDITNYFSDSYQPIDEYGKLFCGDSWNKEDWNGFHAIMVYCIQFYMRNGFVRQDTVSQRLKSFSESYSPNTLDTCQAIENKVTNLTGFLMSNAGGDFSSEQRCMHIFHAYASAKGLKLIHSNGTIAFKHPKENRSTKMTDIELNNLKW